MNNKLSKYLSFVALATCVILLIPFTASHFSTEVVWTLSDYIIAGVMLSLTGSALAFVLSLEKGSYYKIAMGIVIFTSFLLIWANLAVGLVGHEGETINSFYIGVIIIGLTGSVLSRFTAQGMFYTIAFMLLGIALITALALMGYFQEPPYNSVTQILGVNAFFMLTYAIACVLFRRVAGSGSDLVTESESA
jgi:hypothetical protein